MVPDKPDWPVGPEVPAQQVISHTSYHSLDTCPRLAQRQSLEETHNEARGSPVVPDKPVWPVGPEVPAEQGIVETILFHVKTMQGLLESSADYGSTYAITSCQPVIPVWPVGPEVPAQQGTSH